MRAKLTARKTVRLGLITSLLVAATLLLSGCWANVYNAGGGERNITLTKDTSNTIIFNCTKSKGTGAARAFCALDTINSLCRGAPPKGVTDDDCVLMASYGGWQDLDISIRQVIGPGSDCLSYFEHSDPGDNFWGNLPSGEFGCK
jgi:hypothetical protein